MASKVIYPVEKELLHTKNVGKKVLSNYIVKGTYCTEGYAGNCYHYTSPEGLQGILKTRTLYFTDCQFLNDYKERVNINDDLSKFWLHHSKFYDKAFLSLVSDIRIDTYEDYGYSYIDDRINTASPAKYFVFSASENKDSLSMWKYYAKNNVYNGYCIGLATYALDDEWADRETGVAIEEGLVIYDNKKKLEAIANAVNKLYETWCLHKVSEEFNKKIRNDFRSWVSMASLFFKDSCFSDEQEYRFVAIVPKHLLNDLEYEYKDKKYKMYHFRTVDGVLVPYITMPFNYEYVDECWVINSIGISPSLNSKHKELGLKKFLESLDYKLADYSIYESKIPLRY